MTENPNARYYIETANDDECVIVGVGKVVSGDDSIRVRIRVTERRNIIEIIN
jgi:RNA binding exosome subunit